MADSSKHSLYIIKETTYGALPATPTVQEIRQTGVTMALSKDSLESDEAQADRQIAGFTQGANQVAGAVNFELSHGSFDTLLPGALQSADWASNVIKSGVIRSSYSLIREFSDISIANGRYQIFLGCEIDQFQLTMAANAKVTGSFNFIGKSLNIPTAAITGLVKTAANSNPIMNSFIGSISEGGATISVATEVNFTLANGLANRFVVGARDSLEPSVGRSNLTGQLTAYFENKALLQKFLNATESELTIVITDTQTTAKSLTIEIPRLIYTGGQTDTAGGSGENSITIPLPFQALRDATEASNLKITRST